MKACTGKPWTLPIAQDALSLAESPYLMHPVENKRVGLYHNPIAILDFASLYPSLYRHVHPRRISRSCPSCIDNWECNPRTSVDSACHICWPWAAADGVN